MNYFFTFILSLFFSTVTLFADTKKTESQASFFLQHLQNKKVIKSGTPYLTNLLYGDTEKSAAFSALYKTLSRPEMDTFADSNEGHFRVHYNFTGQDAPDQTDTDKNGVPDYVDSTLVYLENAWQVIVVDMGFGLPASDGTKGGSKDIVDCYLQELSPRSLYGFISPDPGTFPVTSYLNIDNDYSEKDVYPTLGYDALKVTTAHEFFHVIHYTYYAGSDAVWWMEHTAVWMEDYIWDDVNDYFNYINFLFSDRDLPIHTQNGSFEYGASLFAFHIAKKYGESYIYSIWNQFKDFQDGSIENFNVVLPQGVAQAISDLGVWLYFTGSRDNSRDFFNDADLMKLEISPDISTINTSGVDTLSFHHYTFKYIEIVPQEGFAYGDTLCFESENPNGGSWYNQLILYSSPNNYKVEKLSGTSPRVFFPRPFDKAILVITNVSTGSDFKTYKFINKFELKTYINVEDNPAPIPFVLQQNYPNPFNNSTTISYSVADNSPVTLKVMNLQGQTVATLVDGFLEHGDYIETFDGTGISSGIYLIVLKSQDTLLRRKMTLIK